MEITFITMEITSPTGSYDEIVMFRVSFAFNDSYILKFQVGYSRILLIKVTYISVKWAASMRVSRLNSLKHFMNLPRYVQGRDEHNNKNEICSKMSCVNSIVLVYING